MFTMGFATNLVVTKISWFELNPAMSESQYVVI